jgi:2-isopropylmalate synthase
VELLIRRAQPGYKSPFELLDFHVLVRSSYDAAEGNGPVNALDVAVRKALLPFYPELADIHLIDYKCAFWTVMLAQRPRPVC